MQEVISKYAGLSKVMDAVAERHWEMFVHGLSVFCFSPQIHSLPFGSFPLALSHYWSPNQQDMGRKEESKMGTNQVTKSQDSFCVQQTTTN